MSKTLLLGLIGGLLATAPVLAYPPALANANFASERGVPFGLALDGRPLTRGLARQVHAGPLLPGAHWADFTVPTAYGGAVRFRSRVWLQPGLETTFVLLARPGQPLALRQVNAVALHGPGHAGGIGYYSNGGRYNSPAPYGQGSGDGNQGGYPSPGQYGDDQGDDGDNEDGYTAAPNGGDGSGANAPNDGPYDSSPNSPNGGYGNNPNSPGGPGYGVPNTPNGPYGSNPGYPDGGPYRSGPTPSSYPGTAASSYRRLAPPDVNALVRTVQARIAEASKLSAAKDGLAQRSLRTDELSRLLRTINSEACRIELATFAYSHVSDPENFGRVYEAFETESGARAVEAAVRNTNQR